MSLPKNPTGGETPQGTAPETPEKELSLEELMAADEADRKREDEEFARKESAAKRKRNLLFGGLGLGVAAALVATVVFINPFGAKPTGDPTGKNTGGPVAANTADSNNGVFTPPEPEWWQVEETKYPLKLEEWQKTDYYSQAGTPESLGVLEGEILSSTAGGEIASASNVLPSRAAGYTDDFNQLLLEDGTLNPLYSAWTKEGFTLQLETAVERFINPYFGGWAGAQYSTWPRSNDDLLPPRFADLFADDYLLEHQADPVSSYLPLYADWEGNDYGMGDQLLELGVRWIGDVQSTTLTFNTDEETGLTSVDAVVAVKYTAWSRDQTKLEKKGTLTLHVVQPSSSGKYFAIDQATLTME